MSGLAGLALGNAPYDCLTAAINVHGAFPKSDLWISRTCIRERTLRLPDSCHQCAWCVPQKRSLD
ncbi:hypothetical protein B5D77_22805 [Microcystis sp. MC19]|nr:hypothetical protein B5D77_22805 [Microcystis sp. MC19]